MTPTARPAASQRRPFRQRYGTLLARLFAHRGIGKLASDRSGASAILIGLLSMVLLGFSALGTEVVYWYTIHRNLQNAADSAALSAVAALENISGTPDSTHKTQATAEAKYTSQQYGFTGGTGGVIVTVNIPPTSGAYTSQATAAEVILSAPQQLFLTSALSFGGNKLFNAKPTQTARAVATPAKNGNGCVVTLDAGTVGITQNGNGNMNLAGCDLYINADSSTALDQNGNATLTAANAYIVGGVTDAGRAALNTSGGTFTGTAPVNDPYANLAPPSFSTSPLTANGCFNASTPTILGATINTVGSVTTVTPTSGDGGTVVFCNENWPGSAANGTFVLTGGLYVFDGGSLGCNSCTVSSASGDGVTIYLTGGTGSSANYAYLSFSGNGTAQLNINAPTTTWMAAHAGTQALLGIAIFGDRNDPCNVSQHTCSVTSTFSGNASATINGAIYIPNQNITWNGNGGNTPTCSQLISFDATMNGNGTFTTSFSDDPAQANNGCNPYHDQTTGLGMAGAGAIPAHLVE